MENSPVLPQINNLEMNNHPGNRNYESMRNVAELDQTADKLYISQI